MRPVHPARRTVVLAAVVLAAATAAPLSAQIPGLRAAAPGPAARTVQPLHLDSLQSRLRGFAAGLSVEERALWENVLLRAAQAPAAGSDVRVSPILEIGPGGGCDGGAGMDEVAGRVVIVVQGGRVPMAVRGADAPRPNPAGTVAIGPKQDDPGRPGGTGTVAIGPKQDDPGRPGRTGVVAIGPKQDDPAPPPQSLGRRLAEFSAGLPAEERAALDWLLTRASTPAPEGGAGRPGGLRPGMIPGGRPGTPGGPASTPAPEDRPGRPGGLRPGAVPGGRPGTPGGPQPGMSVSLRQALGIDRLSIGPKQDDPTPPPPASGWVVRY